MAVMALERVPADIRKEGGVARMSDAEVIKAIKAAVTIPVMAKARIGHFVEAQILEALQVDYVDESEVSTSFTTGCQALQPLLFSLLYGHQFGCSQGFRLLDRAWHSFQWATQRVKTWIHSDLAFACTHHRCSRPRTMRTTSTSTTSRCPLCAGAGTWARRCAVFLRALP